MYHICSHNKQITRKIVTNRDEQVASSGIANLYTDKVHLHVHDYLSFRFSTIFKTEKKIDERKKNRNKINIQKKIQSVKKIVFQLQFLLHVYSPILGSLADLVRDLFLLLMVSFLPSDGLTNKKHTKDEFPSDNVSRDYAIFSHHSRSFGFLFQWRKIQQTRGNKPNYSVSFNHFIA